MRKGDNQRGFTLLELLIAIALIGVIMLIVTGVMRLAHRTVESGERKIEKIERIRTTFSTIFSQVQSGLPLITEEGGAQRSVFMGTSNSLGLATTYSLWSGQGGFVTVSYTIEQGNDGLFSLTASEQVRDAEHTQEAVLLTACDEILFSYFGREVTSEEGQWQEKWDNETKLPEKIMLTISKDQKKLSLIIPLMARGKNDWISLQGTGATK